LEKNSERAYRVRNGRERVGGDDAAQTRRRRKKEKENATAAELARTSVTGEE
jgi:hypothetical protein